MLGINNNSSPTSIKVQNTNGEVHHVTNPEKIAQALNNFFKQKVDLLRQKTNQPPVIPPSSRLEKWLNKRNSPIPPFKLKEIEFVQLRKIMKRLKPKRTHGTDWIDKSSLKLAGPLIEDTLLHLCLSLWMIFCDGQTNWNGD